MAAAQVYPELWGESYSSAAGAAIQAANGDCGWGYSGDWKDPSGNGCTGHYAYNDETCDERCIVVEGIYWASVAYIGGLYTQQRAASIQNEWLLATPDASMAVEPPGVAISGQSPGGDRPSGPTDGDVPLRNFTRARVRSMIRTYGLCSVTRWCRLR